MSKKIQKIESDYDFFLNQTEVGHTQISQSNLDFLIRLSAKSTNTKIDGMTPTEIKQQFQSLHKDLLDEKKKVQDLENQVAVYKSENREIAKQNQRYSETLNLIKQRSSCIMAVGHATKAREREK